MLPILLSLVATLPAIEPATIVVDEKISLERTVEDVETLRVLVTNVLSASAAATPDWVPWKLNANNLRSYRSESKDDDERNGEDDDAGNGDAQSESRADFSRLAALTWLRTAQPQLYADTNGAYVLGNAESVTSYTRAFYAPGIGAWIDTNLKVPYTLVRSNEDGKGSESKGDDDWDAAKRSLKGESRIDSTSSETVDTQSATLTLDQDRIEAAIDAIAEILRKHGHRIRGLASDENIVVALKIEGDGYVGGGNNNVDWTASMLVLRYRGGLTVRGDSGQSKSIVIRASRELIEAAAADDVDAAAFRSRLAITRY